VLVIRDAVAVRGARCRSVVCQVRVFPDACHVTAPKATEKRRNPS
jgi:hypothetical protein